MTEKVNEELLKTVIGSEVFAPRYDRIQKVKEMNRATLEKYALNKSIGMNRMSLAAVLMFAIGAIMGIILMSNATIWYSDIVDDKLDSNSIALTSIGIELCEDERFHGYDITSNDEIIFYCDTHIIGMGD